MHILYLVNEVNSGPGVLLEEATAQGATHSIVRTFVGEPVPANHEGYDGLVVMGGIMGVYQDTEFPFIEDTRALMRAFHAAGKPIMGVCLGAQMLASAFGAKVYKMGFDEWGFLPQTWDKAAKDDPLLHDATPGLRIMQWHGDTFDLPDGAVRLATREKCPNQAFRIGAKSYGFQFHLEVTQATTDYWIELRAESQGKDAETLRTTTHAEALPAAQDFAREVMRRWMRL
jgi:GMP synthase (glutamine-hydrolysing)